MHFSIGTFVMTELVTSAFVCNCTRFYDKAARLRYSPEQTRTLYVSEVEYSTRIRRKRL